MNDVERNNVEGGMKDPAQRQMMADAMMGGQPEERGNDVEEGMKGPAQRQMKDPMIEDRPESKGAMSKGGMKDQRSDRWQRLNGRPALSGSRRCRGGMKDPRSDRGQRPNGRPA